ncbi:MAG: hypothetical protein Q9194_004122 [Teloschistes cf. exilis]
MVDSSDPSTKLPNLTRGFTSDIVTILVGDKEVPFTLHKAIISSKSKFFRAAMEGSFKEAVEKKVRLPEEDPDLFPHYLSWVYGNDSMQLDHEDDETYANELCHLWLLAWKLGSEKLENLIINMVCRRAMECSGPFLPDVEVINLIWDTIPTQCLSGLRQLLVDVTAWKGNDFTGLPELANTRPQFLYAVLKEYANILDDDVQYSNPSQRCKRYHRHKSSTPCQFGSRRARYYCDKALRGSTKL